MKKISTWGAVYTLLFIANVHGILAAPDTEMPRLVDKIKLGARIGLNRTYSSITFPDTIVNTSLQIKGDHGNTVGAYGEYGLIGHIGIRLTVQHDAKSIASISMQQHDNLVLRNRLNSVTLGIEASCWSIAPTLHLYPFKGHSFCIYGGFQFSKFRKAKLSAKLSGNSASLDLLDENKVQEFIAFSVGEQAASFMGKICMRRSVVNIITGVEHEFKNGITLGCHNIVGLDNLVMVTETPKDTPIKNIINKLQCKVTSTAVTVGYNFAKLLK